MRSTRGRAATAFASALAVLLTIAGAAAAQTRVPRVVGPLPASEASHPFGGAAWQMAPEDLAAHGYVEEEYLLSGRANVYEWTPANTATVRTAGVPYTTRVLVRRPIRKSRMSGTAIIEPLNPSNAFDLNIGWGFAGEQIMRNGDVWVGFTSKPIAVRALKTFDPERYESLSWANPLPLDDPRNCTTLQTLVDPVALRSRESEDGLVWDILSQVGAWVKSDTRRNPMFRARGGSAIDRAYAFGYSQTGSMLITYINAIQPRVIAEDGRPIFDGYLVAVAGGAFIGAAPLNQCSPVPPLGDPRRSLANARVPVIQMMSQSDYLTGIASRRPDSDTRTDMYRHYEMAGAAHATPEELLFSARPADILAAGRAVPPMSCNEGQRSRFPNSIFVNAALQNIDLWSREGVPAPRGLDIQVVNGQPVLDQFGNAVGGLRSPYLDVPTSTWRARATGASFCGIAGYEVPFTPERLAELYPTQGAYVRAVRQSVDELVRSRYLTWEDGQEIIREAASTPVRPAGA